MVDLGRKTVRSWTRLMRAHARISAHVEAALKATGLPTVASYTILNELERGAPEGMRPYEIEKATGEAQYNVSRLIDRLAKANLVERRPCDDDRRGWRIALTDLGRAMRARMWDIYSAALVEIYVDRLSEKQIRSLDDILGDLVRRPR